MMTQNACYEPTIKIVLDDGAYAPIRAHKDDAGLDLRTPIDITVPARGSVVIDTGVISRYQDTMQDSLTNSLDETERGDGGFGSTGR